MKTAYKWTIASLIAAIVIALAVWLQNHQSLQLVIHPQSGSLIQYRIHYETKGQSHLTDPTAAAGQVNPGNLALKFDGVLQLQVLESHPDHSEVEGLLAIESFQGLQTSSMIGRHLPFRATLTRHGKIKDITFKKEGFIDDSYLTIEVLRFLHHEFPLEKVDIDSHWNYLEPHHPKNLTLQTHIAEISNYQVRMQASYAEGPQNREKNSKKTVYDRSRNMIASIIVQRNLISRGLGSLAITNSVSFSAELIPNGQAITLVAIEPIPVQSEELVVEDLSQSQLLKITKERQWKKILNNQTADLIQSALLTANLQNRQENMPLYQSLKALFMLQPETISTFLDFLLKYSIDDERFNMVATALTYVGNKEAQHLLRTAIDASDEEERKIRLIPNLSFCEKPNAESIAFVESLRDTSATKSIEITAHYALGTIAHQLRDSDTANSNRILNDYAHRLQQSNSNAESAHFLTTIGNIGAPQQIEIVRPYLNSDQIEIKEKAFDSLRHVASIEAKAILVEAVAEQKEARLKEIAASGLTYGQINEDISVEIVDLLNNETNIQVIKSLVISLANNAERYPQHKTIIQKFLDNCGHPDLCGFVEGIVASFDKS
ncbi:MAG: hypothetical protein ACOH5I_10860 [Oligoflexus sp.]